MFIPAAMTTEVTLRAGAYEAVLVPSGAGLTSLTYEGKNLVRPHPPQRRAKGYSGKILLPWPNRIAGAQYQFDGSTYHLDANDRATGSALHGLVHTRNWEVTQSSSDQVTFATVVEPSDGYPFRLEATARYRLRPDAGLHLEVTTWNQSEKPAPFGIGAHPYLTCDGAPLDQCLLTVPASVFLEVNERLIPTGHHSVGGTLVDFRTERVVGDVALDHAFGDLPRTWSVTLADPATQMAVRLDSDTRWVQLFSAEDFGRRCLAVEPMTCPPNAFNTGWDLITLEPGGSNVFTLGIRRCFAQAKRLS